MLAKFPTHEISVSLNKASRELVWSWSREKKQQRRANGGKTDFDRRVFPFQELPTCSASRGKAFCFHPLGPIPSTSTFHWQPQRLNPPQSPQIPKLAVPPLLWNSISLFFLQSWLTFSLPVTTTMKGHFHLVVWSADRGWSFPDAIALLT